MKERGPVFITAFSPLSMVIVAVLSSFILSEKLFLGSVIGALVIVVGLYLVVWGKSKDHEQLSDGLPVSNESPQATSVVKVPAAIDAKRFSGDERFV